MIVDPDRQGPVPLLHEQIRHQIRRMGLPRRLHRIRLQPLQHADPAAHLLERHPQAGSDLRIGQLAQERQIGQAQFPQGVRDRMQGLFRLEQQIVPHGGTAQALRLQGSQFPL